MTTEALQDTIHMGKGGTMTFLRNGERLTRNHIAGEPNADILDVPPHWHETHDEIFHVVKGQIQVRIGSTCNTYAPEDGEIVIPKGTVHALRSIRGVELIFEEKTNPKDDEKELFFRNLFATGKQAFNLFDAMQVFYYGDTLPAFPGHIKWIERLFVIVFGAYLAPLFGYKLAFKPDQKTK